MEKLAGTIGCIGLLIALAFWALVIWGLWELVHLIARI